jgi:hypothetical protein
MYCAAVSNTKLEVGSVLVACIETRLLVLNQGHGRYKRHMQWVSGYQIDLRQTTHRPGLIQNCSVSSYPGIRLVQDVHVYRRFLRPCVVWSWQEVAAEAR